MEIKQAPRSISVSALRGVGCFSHPHSLVLRDWKGWARDQTGVGQDCPVDPPWGQPTQRRGLTQFPAGAGWGPSGDPLTAGAGEPSWRGGLDSFPPLKSLPGLAFLGCSPHSVYIHNFCHPSKPCSGTLCSRQPAVPCPPGFLAPSTEVTQPWQP